MKNPFLTIVPVEGEKLLDREQEIAELHLAVNRELKGDVGGIVVKGDPGVGKTSLVRYVLSTINSPNVNIVYRILDNDTVHFLATLKLDRTYLIAIDDVNNEEGFADNKRIEFHNFLEENSSKVHFILIDNRKRDISKEIKIENLKIIELGGLSYEDIKNLVIDRLNTIRNKPSNDISPFTEKELKQVYEKTKGNPRFVLLILATLFDEKFQQ